MRINASVKQIKLNLDKYQQMISCTTEDRPVENLVKGQCIFDETLNKPIWWNGTIWVDAMGAEATMPESENPDGNDESDRNLNDLTPPE